MKKHVAILKKCLPTRFYWVVTTKQLSSTSPLIYNLLRIKPHQIKVCQVCHLKCQKKHDKIFTILQNFKNVLRKLYLIESSMIRGQTVSHRIWLYTVCKLTYFLFWCFKWLRAKTVKVFVRWGLRTSDEVYEPQVRSKNPRWGLRTPGEVKEPHVRSKNPRWGLRTTGEGLRTTGEV